ncbi:archaellin/type IV pilin N-terminal domain-containing protein [Candidatus Nitrosotenuis aquarius]|uniref:archaellin/type IV pilin N-terminal domain-containing protein n=1 Tax=Candidatus Nitrosotenuis aquarius TaxID=1846278 RepID=UPI000C1F05D5|nr:archaellin/type IV pilin N-terminal domain-containing protein [Candidatus Nitrosotenuis aquarius]
MNTYVKNRRLHSRRGVAPVIATLLLVAIAVVGGAIVFAYSQNFFSSSQLSGRPTIEAVKILGYDARAIPTIVNQNGVAFTTAGGDADALKEVDEEIAVYVKNDSVQSITIGELRFGGQTYTYTTNPATLGALTAGQYTIAGSGAGDGIINNPVAEVLPGQTLSVVVALSEDMKSGRDTQFKITTTNGAVFVGTVVIGQQSG